MRSNKPVLIILGITFLLAVIVMIMAISSLFSPSHKNSPENIPTPTLVPYTRDPNGQFIFTPLQRTVINKTTDKEIQEKNHVISKSRLGEITSYIVTSNTIGQTDEIRTKNGVVIFESINIFNKKTGSYPPKVSVYQKEFGQPEKILKSVSPLGIYISAYIYASDGFTLFVNHNTNTVYVVQRFTPMSLAAYEKTYADYIQPAPEYPQEAPITTVVP